MSHTSQPIRVLAVGAGHMGRSHALAYHQLDQFQLAGIVTRSAKSREALNTELGGGYDLHDDYHQALDQTPDLHAVSISTYPDTHYPYAKAALQAGKHVFIEKPLAETLEQATELIELAREKQLILCVGYILRVHPSWVSFVERSQQLGKPLVMRMNLNQQSSGDNWETHKNLMSSISPIVDCGVHYVDIMCQMTQSRPIRVSGIGARLTDELPEGKINYGQLQVTFEDGSVGWYEAGWGPMMSEQAFFIKDVVGPKGALSIEAREAASEGASSDVNSHTKTNSLRLHHAKLDKNNQFKKQDQWFELEDEPDHDQLCAREQELFAAAIHGEADLTEHLVDTLNSMRIVLAADQSFRTGKTIDLS